MMMHYALAVGLVLLNTLWLGFVVLGLPGNWLMVLSTLLVAWWQWDAAAHGGPALFHLATLIAVVALAVLGEVLEFFAGVAGAKRAGGTRKGAIGALVGGIGGAIAGTLFIPIPVLGSLLGACGGAGLGACLFELSAGRRIEEATRAGVGAGRGRLMGTLYKIFVGVAIWLIVAIAAFWP